MRTIYYCPANTDANKEKWIDYLKQFGNVVLATRDGEENVDIVESLEEDDVVIVSTGFRANSNLKVSVGRGVYECLDTETDAIAYFLSASPDLITPQFQECESWYRNAGNIYREWGYLKISRGKKSLTDLFGPSIKDKTDPVPARYYDPFEDTTKPMIATLSPGVAYHYLNG
mgnify:CR=1 FL=1